MITRRISATFALLLLSIVAPALLAEARQNHAERDQDNWLTYGHGFGNQR